MKKGTDTILVTGATGSQGGSLAHELLRSGHKIRAMTRHPDNPKAQALAKLGATIVEGDLNSEDSLRKAMKGAWGVFAVQNTWEAGVEGEEEQGKRQAKIAREVGVEHYVYSSVASAQRKTGIPHFENKWRIEETVRELDFPSFSVVRPVFFMENLLGPWFKPYIDQGTLAVGIKPTTKLQMIAVADIGKYLKLPFEDQDDWNGRELDIAGDELTMPEAAKILSQVTGRTIQHYQVPIAEVRKGSDDFATMLEWFDAVGYDADIEGNAKQYGIKPTRFAEWARSVKW